MRDVVRIDFGEATAAQRLGGRTLFAGAGEDYPFAFSNDGDSLASLCGDKPVVWNCMTGAESYTVERRTCDKPTFSPRDSFLAAANGAEGVEVWIHPGGDLANRFVIPDARGAGWTGEVQNLLFTEDETRISVVTDRAVRSWSIVDSREMVLFRLPQGEEPLGARECLDGRLLLYSFSRREPSHVRVTDILAQESLLEVALDGPDAKPIRVSSDGSLLLTREKDRYAVRELKDGKLVCTYPYAGQAESPFITKDGQYVIEPGPRLRVVDARTGSIAIEFEFAQLSVHFAYADSTGVLAAAWCGAHEQQGRVLFLDLLSGTVLADSPKHTNRIMFSACGRWFASVADAFFLQIRDNWPAPCGTVVLTDMKPLL